MLCIFDLPGLSVWESGNNVSLITLSIALLVLSFCAFFTNTGHFPDDSVKYVGSMPIIDGMSSSRSLIPLFIETSGIMKMGTIPV